MRTSMWGCAASAAIAVVLRARVEVVEQQPHPHAAVGGLEQLLREIDPGEVRVPDVGLDIEAPRRKSSALHAHDEGFRAFGDEAERGFAGMPRFRACDQFVQGAASAGAIAVTKGKSGRGGSCAQPPTTTTARAERVFASS